MQRPGVLEPLEQGGGEVGDGRRALTLDVLDPEAAAEVDDPGLPVQLVAALGREAAEPVDARPGGLRVEELRADV